MLREAAAPAVLYGCAITGIARDGRSGKTSITWQQGGAQRRVDNIDLLIAADGRYSQVRRALAGEASSRMVGVAISRVLVPDSSRGRIDDYEQWFNGPNRLLAFRVPPDHVYVATAFPIPSDQPIPERLKEPDALRGAFTPLGGRLSDQGRWLLDTVCANVADMHWARMQEHDVLYADPLSPVLYLGDAAHGMVPTLGQGATQAIEDAAVAAGLIAREWAAGGRHPRAWLRDIETLRSERMRFTMEFSLQATDTMLEGADPVAGTLHKKQPDFMAKLRRLYREVPGLPAMTKS